MSKFERFIFAVIVFVILFVFIFTLYFTGISQYLEPNFIFQQPSALQTDKIYTSEGHGYIIVSNLNRCFLKDKGDGIYKPVCKWQNSNNWYELRFYEPPIEKPTKGE